MKSKVSAGLLMYKFKNSRIEVFIVHPGGPFFKHKDEGTWSIPKGEIEEGEDYLEAAQREMLEETGVVAKGPFAPLGEVVQKAGKHVHGWAFEGDWSGLLMCKSYASIEWPSRSGKIIRFPEVDKAGFFSPESAKKKINPAQAELIDRLITHLAKTLPSQQHNA